MVGLTPYIHRPAWNVETFYELDCSRLVQVCRYSIIISGTKRDEKQETHPKHIRIWSLDMCIERKVHRGTISLPFVNDTFVTGIIALSL